MTPGILYDFFIFLYCGGCKSKVVPNIDEIMKARADGGAKMVVPPAMPRAPGLQPKLEASPTKLSL